MRHLSNFESLKERITTHDESTAEPPDEGSPSRRDRTEATELLVRDLICRYEAGETVSALAGELGMHHRTVKKHLESASVTIRTRDRKLDDQQIDQAVQLYANGLSTQQIGDRFDVSHNTVRRHLRNRGVQLRPMGRPPRAPD